MESGERRKSARISELEAKKAQKLKKPNMANGNLGTGNARFKQKQGRKRVKAGTSSDGNHNTNASIPERSKLQLLLSVLQGKDSNNFFAEPVDEEEVEFYYEVIKEPMDFGTIAAKINEGSYVKLEDFEHDVNLVFANAMLFNASNTIYYKEAHSIKRLAEDLLQVLKTDPEELENTVSNLNPKRGRPSKADTRVSKSNFLENTDWRSEIDKPFVNKRVDYMPWEAFIKSNLPRVRNNSEPLVHVNQENFGYDPYKQNAASVSQLQALRCQVPGTGLQKGVNIFPSLNLPGNLVGHQIVSHGNKDIECGASNGNNMANHRNTCGSLDGLIGRANYSREKLWDLQETMDLSSRQGFGVGSAYGGNMDNPRVVVQLGASLPRNASMNTDLYSSATQDKYKQTGKLNFGNMMLDCTHIENDAQNNLGASTRLKVQDGNGLDVNLENMNKQSVGIQSRASIPRPASAFENLYSSATWGTNNQPGKYQLTSMMLDANNMDNDVHKALGESSRIRVQNDGSLSNGMEVGWENMNKYSTGFQLGPSLPKTLSADENLFSSATWVTNNQPVKGHIANMMHDGKAPVAGMGFRMQDPVPLREGVDIATALRLNTDKQMSTASLPRTGLADRRLYPPAIWNSSKQIDKLTTNVITNAKIVEKHLQTEVSGSQAIGSVLEAERIYNGGVHEVRPAANKDEWNLNCNLEQGSKNLNWLKSREMGKRAETFNWLRPKEKGVEPQPVIEDLFGQAGCAYWNGCSDTQHQNPKEDCQNRSRYGIGEASAGGLPNNYQLHSPKNGEFL